MLFFSVIAGLPYYYGKMVKNTKHGWNIWLVMFITSPWSGILATWYFRKPNPIHVLSNLELTRRTP